MQHTGLGQISKTILTITGLMLLIIFGARAASQASSIAAVGGEVKKANVPTKLHIGRLAVLSRAESTQQSPSLSYAEKVIEVAVTANTISEATTRPSINTLKSKAEASVKNSLSHAQTQAADSIDNVKNTPSVRIQTDRASAAKKLSE